MLIKLVSLSLILSCIIVGSISCKNALHPIHSAPSALSSTGIPPVPDSLARKLSRYQNWNFATFVDWAPGGAGIIALRRATETTQLSFSAKPGDSLMQLTSLPETVLHACVCPDASRHCLLFTLDSGGNENFQIYSLDLASRRPVKLTRDNAQNDGMVWSNKGDKFAYSSNRRNGRDFDIYITRAGLPGADSIVLSKSGSWSAVDWAPDDRKLLAQRYVSRTSSSLYLLDLATATLDPLIDSCDTVSQELGAWAKDGKGVFYTSDKHTDFRCLCHVDSTGKHEKTLTPDIPWDVREISLSKDRNLLAFSTNENGFSQVYLMDARTFAFRKAPPLPRGIISALSFNPSGTILAMTINTPERPDEIYALDMQHLSVTRWAKSNLGDLEATPFIRPELHHYPTFDSVSGSPRQIPCLVYKPIHRKAPYPVLISIHGGPESQYWPSFRPDVQFLIDELGVAVAAPNVRGSGGYGKAWLTLDNGYKREDAVRDIGCLLDWIAKQPDLDPARVAVSGGSYGGYLTLATMARFNSRLRAGIDYYGISNFITFLDRTSAYRRDLRRIEYGDERDPAMRKFLKEISPITHADKITKPLLIIQGANDARVPLEESQQIAEALKKKGTPVRMLVAGDEGHGFRKKSNRDFQDCAIAMFLKEYLAQ
jgi:Tol biopolymer transport system component/dienelactone hydrolase